MNIALILAFTFALGSPIPDAGHLIGSVSVKNKQALFTFCNGGTWKLEGGAAYDELLEVHSKQTRHKEADFIVTLYLKGKRIDVVNNPGLAYWAKATVEQVVEVHESTSC